MMSEQLNVVLVRRLLNERGLKLGWVKSQIGLGTTAGTLMLNRGVLPQRTVIRTVALEKLAQLLGVEASQLLLRLEAKQTA